MEAFRIGNLIIAAECREEACLFYREETGGEEPIVVETLGFSTLVPLPNGTTVAIREIVNEVMDERNMWLRLGVLCDLRYPFIVGKFP